MKSPSKILTHSEHALSPSLSFSFANRISPFPSLSHSPSLSLSISFSFFIRLSPFIFFSTVERNLSPCYMLTRAKTTHRSQPPLCWFYAVLIKKKKKNNNANFTSQNRDIYLVGSLLLKNKKNILFWGWISSFLFETLQSISWILRKRHKITRTHVLTGLMTLCM